MKHSSANTKTRVVVAALCVAAGCTPAHPRATTADAVRAPSVVLPPVAFAASGRARFVSPDGGEVTGRLQVRVQPPARAWAEIQSAAMFGLVGDRVVACLPGDGAVLVQEDRDDRLERLEFSQSWAADLVPGGTVAALLDWAAGRVGASGPSDGRGDGVRVQSDRDGRPQHCEWWAGGERRLVVDYERWRPAGGGWVPCRIRASARGGFRTEIEFDHVAARDSFAAADFQVDGNPEGR